MVYFMIHTQIKGWKVAVVLVFWVVRVVMGKPLAREFVVCRQILSCTVQNEYLLACASNYRADKWPIQLYHILRRPYIQSTSSANQTYYFLTKCHHHEQNDVHCTMHKSEQRTLADTTPVSFCAVYHS